jgi:hypothetical protein
MFNRMGRGKTLPFRLFTFILNRFTLNLLSLTFNLSPQKITFS